MKNIYIIGVGLIGGSLALNIKKLNPNAVIYGIDNKPERRKWERQTRGSPETGQLKRGTHVD